MFFIDNLSQEQKNQAYSTIEKLSLPSKRYYILTILGVIIATLGLLLNNSSIIIGAMLVAPLMLPILSLCLAVITGHIKLLLKSINTLSKGITISIVIATFITLFIPIFELPQEVLIRSNPNILDLFIAIAAGAAAIYATIKKDSATLPGVAISLSLMPPLSTIGIGLATKNMAVASGAGLLFFTNLVAIIFSGTIILFLFGFKPSSKNNIGVVKQSAIIDIILLLIVSIILTSSFNSATINKKKKHQVKDELIRQLIALDKGELESFKIELQKDEIIISAKILSSKNLTSEDMEILTNALAYRLEESVNLKITIIPVAIGGKILPESEKEEIRKEKKENPELVEYDSINSNLRQPYAAPLEPANNKDKNNYILPLNNTNKKNDEETFPFPED